MNRKHKDKFSIIFGLTNVKRCMVAAFLSVAFFPVLLLASVVEPGFAANFLIPVAFFSAGSAAFAYLLRQVAKHKMKQYYDPVTWIYLAAFHLFFAYLAKENILFYFIVVVLAAYMVQVSLERYIIMAMGELLCFLAVVVPSEVTEISAGMFLLLAGVHLFAFVLSRDFYNTKKNFLIEERKLRREKQESEHDPLTRLLNRRGLERRVEENWKTSVNRQETVAVLMVAVDSFKAYSDRVGRGQGKLCIQRVARTIINTVRGDGITAHVGDAEFLIFVRGRQVQEIYDLAEQIRINAEDMRLFGGNTNNGIVTVSVGFDVRYATQDVSFKALCDRADSALYQAQQEGRNSVRSSQDMTERQAKIS